MRGAACTPRLRVLRLHTAANRNVSSIRLIDPTTSCHPFLQAQPSLSGSCSSMARTPRPPAMTASHPYTASVRTVCATTCSPPPSQHEVRGGGAACLPPVRLQPCSVSISDGHHAAPLQLLESLLPSLVWARPCGKRLQHQGHQLQEAPPQCTAVRRKLLPARAT